MTANPAPLHAARASSKAAGRRPGALRGRMGGLLMLLAALLGAAVVVSATMGSPAANGNAVQTVNGEFDSSSVEFSGAELEFFDPRTQERRWRLEAQHVALDELVGDVLTEAAAVGVVEPRLLLYSREDARKVEAEIVADLGTVDPAERLAVLAGNIVATLSPHTPEQVEVRLDGPLEIRLLDDLESDLRGATATANGRVIVRNRRLELQGEDLLLDLDSHAAELARNVRVVAQLEQPVDLAGSPVDTLTVTCRGRARYEEAGGERGITPTLEMRDRVVVLASDGSRLDANVLRVMGNPASPERILLHEGVNLRLQGIGTLDGDWAEIVQDVRPTAEADGQWQVHVHAAAGERLAGSIEIASATGDARRLELSCGERASYEQDVLGQGALVFAGALDARVLLPDGADTGARLNASEGLRATLRGNRKANRWRVAALDSLIATGNVSMTDPGGEAALFSPQLDLWTAMTASASRQAELSFDATGRVRELILDGDCRVDAAGVDPSLWDTGSMPVADVVSKESADEGDDPERVDLELRCDRAVYEVPAEGHMTLAALGSASLTELSHGEGVLRRKATGQSVRVHRRGTETSVLIDAAPGETLEIQDHTSSETLVARGTKLEGRGDMVILHGEPAQAQLGAHTATSSTLIVEPRLRKLSASVEPLQLMLDPNEGEGETLAAELIEIVASSVRLLPATDSAGERVLVNGAPGTQVTVALTKDGRDLYLRAPSLEVDPKTQDLRAPEGGSVRLDRRLANGRTERVDLSATRELLYFPSAGRAEGRGNVLARADRGSRPFEIRADQAVATLANGGTDIQQVVATGSVKLKSANLEAEGHQVDWTPATETGVLKPLPGNVVHVRDAVEGVEGKCRKMTFREGEGARTVKLDGGSWRYRR